MHNALRIHTADAHVLSSPDPSSVFFIAGEELVEGLPASEVHRRALAARNTLGGAQRSLCFWLLEVEKRRLHEEFGCSSTFHYAEVYLQLSPHTISEMLRTAREIERFPLFAQALSQGKISTSKVREISRVAIESTERFWLDAARKHSQREIERMVAFTPKGALPTGSGLAQKEGLTKGGMLTKEKLPPEGRCNNVTAEKQDSSETVADECSAAILKDLDTSIQAVTETTAGEDSEKNNPEGTIPASEFGCGIKYNDRLILELSGEQMAVVKDAFDKARRESGLKDRASLLEFIARAYLSADRTPEASGSKPPYQVVLHAHPATGLAWCESVNGERYLDSQVIEKALCDAEIIKAGSDNHSYNHDTELHTSSIIDSKADNHIPESSPTLGLEQAFSGENSLMAYINSIYAQYKKRGTSGCKRHRGREQRHSGSRTVTSIPRTIRRKVMLRDQCTCQNPGCGSRLYIVLHHIVPLGAGGENVESNIIVLCSRCHDLVHRGKVTISGKAPHGLTWGKGSGAALRD